MDLFNLDFFFEILGMFSILLSYLFLFCVFYCAITYFGTLRILMKYSFQSIFFLNILLICKIDPYYRLVDEIFMLFWFLMYLININYVLNVTNLMLLRSNLPFNHLFLSDFELFVRKQWHISSWKNSVTIRIHEVKHCVLKRWKSSGNFQVHHQSWTYTNRLNDQMK